jgi:L-amino acid N-acyltransferase YncA
MEFQIRAAQLPDAPHIAHVQVESWRTTYQGIVPDTYIASLDKEARTHNWQEWLASNGIQVFVAEDAAGIFGFLSGGAIRDPAEDYDAELYVMYLLNTHQKQGAGRALMRTLASSLHAQGFKRLLVWALEANQPAIAFYQRLGAILVATKSIDIGGKELSDLALGWPDLSQLRQKQKHSGLPNPASRNLFTTSIHLTPHPHRIN